IAAGEVLVTGDGDEIAGHDLSLRAGERMRHVLDKTGFAAARRSFEKDRQPAGIGGLEDAHLVANRQVVGLLSHGASNHSRSVLWSGGGEKDAAQRAPHSVTVAITRPLSASTSSMVSG